MSSSNGIRLIEAVKHKSGQTADIQFNVRTGLFYCSTRTLGQRIEGADFAEVKKQVIARLDALNALVFEPVIQVDSWQNAGVGANAYQTTGFVRLRIARYWLARRSNVAPMICWKWEDQHERMVLLPDDRGLLTRPSKQMVAVNRENESKEFVEFRGPHDYVLPCHVSSSSPFQSGVNFSHDAKSTSYYPYSDELWDGLNKIIEAVEKARKQINELVSTNEGADHLIAFAMPPIALPAESQEDSK